MEFRIGDVSDDGYWVFTESGWQATEQQKQALEQGAAPYEPEQPQSDNGVENVQIVTIPTNMSGQFSDSSVWVWRIAAGAICLIGVVVFLILILSPSEAERELTGKWENEVDSLDFKENGDLDHQGEIYDGWSISGTTIVFTDSDDYDYEYHYKYEIKGKILFLAPLDDDGEPVSGDCIAMVKQGYDFYDEFDEVTDPYWCTYE